MATKYFCDVCSKEIADNKRVSLFTLKTDLRTLCLDCWKKAENILLKYKKIESRKTLI